MSDNQIVLFGSMEPKSKVNPVRDFRLALQNDGLKGKELRKAVQQYIRDNKPQVAALEAKAQQEGFDCMVTKFGVTASGRKYFDVRHIEAEPDKEAQRLAKKAERDAEKSKAAAEKKIAALEQKIAMLKANKA